MCLTLSLNLQRMNKTWAANQLYMLPHQSGLYGEASRRSVWADCRLPCWAEPSNFVWQEHQGFSLLWKSDPIHIITHSHNDRIAQFSVTSVHTVKQWFPTFLACQTLKLSNVYLWPFITGNAFKWTWVVSSYKQCFSILNCFIWNIFRGIKSKKYQEFNEKSKKLEKRQIKHYFV